MRSLGLMLQFKKYGLGLIIVWTCILAAFLVFIIDEYREDTIKEATREARDYHDLNLHYRRWSARIGGVYAPTDKVAPNPHLVVPDRDVKTESGKSLTLVNPAYMTRMVFETIRKDSENPIINRLVSLKPLNPANAPNAWELETLRLFESSTVRERSQVLRIEERPYLQFMAAFITEEGCLKCHAHQGYRIGDIRGGMSIAIPISGYLALEAERKNLLFGGVALLWVLGTAGIAVSSKKKHEQEMKILEKNVTLEAEVFERLRIQEQLEEQAGMLEEEVAEHQRDEEELCRKNVEIEQFLYTVSHDLRSPLVTVKTFLGYLEQDISAVNSTRIGKDLEFLHSAADRMEALLRELLDMARLGRSTLPNDLVTYREMLVEALDAVAGQISTGRVDLRVNDADLALCGDRRRLLQIWQNLLDNALKYMGDQAEPRIEIGVDQQEDETVFYVSDNGIGIAPEYQKKVFGIFEKLDRHSDGVGMGLTMVWRIVELYGGRIWVESRGEGQGSCFRFTLPEALQRGHQERHSIEYPVGEGTP